MIIPDRDIPTPRPSPTLTRPRAATAFQLGSDAGFDDEEEAEHSHEKRTGGTTPEVDEDEVDGVTLEDDDFESHYSRRESSESEEEDEDEDETLPDDDRDEDDEHDQNGRSEGGGYFPSSSDRPDALSRVRSLPSRPPLSQPQVNAQAGHHAPGLHTSQSTTSLPPPPPPPLYPPFYNRPPTPLPPSPSLTSLLRPPSLLNRSTASTRPTTPDSSDVETPNDTEAAVAHSARRAHPLPPTSPKVPTYEYYGFVLYLASTLAFIIYILWSYLPSPFLHALGITYYPNRWWSLALPAWIVMLLIFIYVALLSFNVEYLTLPLTSLECMVDDAANVAVIDEAGRVRKGGSKRWVKELEQRAKFELEMELFTSKGGKGRKHSTSGGGSSQRTRGKGKRKSSRTSTDHVHSSPPEIPARDYPGSPSSYTVASASGSHSHAAANPYQNSSTFPFITTSTHPTQAQHEFQVQNTHLGFPNWKLTWNEGTDAVMDIPIGGVCEVLYG